MKNIGLIVAALGLMVMAACGRTEEPAGASARLPQLPLDPAAVTVSGISAGGYMAVQFHVAHSALVRGAGIVAAGPYFCAEASLRHALGCWDWWGYEGEAYATQAGPQVRAVRSMIADLLGEPTAAAR